MTAPDPSARGDALARLGFVVALLIPLAAGVAAWLWGRPWLVTDTATGIATWQAWLSGGPWNCLPGPDPTDINRDVTAWVSWWSPGQYVWPGLFLSLGSSLGAALIVAAVIAAWFRSLGVYLLLRTLTCSPRAAALAVFVEAANWHLFSSFGMFNGGEVVQAALLPWLLLGIARLRGRVGWWLFTLPPLLFAAAFAKHSLFLAALGGLAWLWWETNHRRGSTARGWLGTAALLIVCGLVARWAVQRWIVAGGPTPGDAGQVPHGWMLALGYPVFGPWSAATGFGSIGGRIFHLMGIDFNQGWQRLSPVLLGLIPVWIIGYIGLMRFVPSAALQRLFVTFVPVFILGLSVLLLRGASISIEDRHFRPAGLLVIAGLAAVAVDSTGAAKRVRRALQLLLATIAVYGIATVVMRVAHLHRLDRVGPSGIMQPNLSREASAELVRRDALSRDRSQLIYFCDPSSALEARHSRRLITDAMIRPVEWLHERQWRGRVPQLLLVLPASWQNDPRATAIQASFVDYDPEEWRSEVVGDCLFISTQSRAL